MAIRQKVYDAIVANTITYALFTLFVKSYTSHYITKIVKISTSVKIDLIFHKYGLTFEC